MSIFRRRLMMQKSETSPYDAEVEYIQSTGTQYISTGIKPSETVVTEVRFALTEDYPFDNTSAIFGVFHNNGTYYSVSFPSLNYARIPSGGSSYANIPITMSLGTVHNISYKSEAFYFDEELKGTQKPKIGTNNSLNILLFGRAASPSGSSRIIAGIRVYGFKMIDSGNILHDCIPVRIGTAGYLFDKVNNALMTNLGSGDFLIGDDI